MWFSCFDPDFRTLRGSLARVPAAGSALALVALFAGCAVGPDYRRPETTPPPSFVEAGPWKVAAPKDQLPRDGWWKIYGDPVLDRLETEAAQASPTLQAAVARRDQAWAAARVDRADFFPQVGLNPQAERARGANRRTDNGSRTGNTFVLPVDLSYELDLWGRVRRQFESGRARAEAGEADYHQVLLSVQADVARFYFSLRALDEERALLARNLDSRARSLDIVRKRFELGVGGDYEVNIAETERASAESDLLAVDQERTALRYALAVLCGRLPENFALDFGAGGPLAVPAVPVGLPSELLERRSDVAAAERRLAAANAEIGVAQAAFFPSIRLVGSAGYGSDELNTLLNWDNRQWSFGPAISLPLFTGGRNRANFERSKAAYEEALADYRQSVLVAFQDVETALSDLRNLAQRSQVLERAVASSRRAADLVALRYRSGQIGYLDVADAERTAILNERLAVQVRSQQQAASVVLIKALGGGW